MRITAFGYVDGGKYDGYVVIRGLWSGITYMGDKPKENPGEIRIIDAMEM
jgi:hypothetical protein